MRVMNESTHEAEYWSDFLDEFGSEEYLVERYFDARDNLRSVYDTVESWLLAVSNLTEVSGGKRVSTEQRVEGDPRG